MSAEREAMGRAAFAMLAIVAAVALTSGCSGSAYDNARSTVATTAQVVAAADSIAAEVVTERIAETDTIEELEREERRAERVSRAFVGVHASLLAADSTLDAVATGALDDSTWKDTVACLLPALLGLVDALREYGLAEAYTEPIRMAVGLLSGFLGGSCGGAE